MWCRQSLDASTSFTTRCRTALIFSTAHLTSGENPSVSFHHNRMQSSSSPMFLTDSCSLFSAVRLLPTFPLHQVSLIRLCKPQTQAVLEAQQYQKGKSWAGTAAARNLLGCRNKTILADEVSVTAALVLTDFMWFTLHWCFSLCFCSSLSFTNVILKA